MENQAKRSQYDVVSTFKLSYKPLEIDNVHWKSAKDSPTPPPICTMHVWTLKHTWKLKPALNKASTQRTTNFHFHFLTLPPLPPLKSHVYLLPTSNYNSFPSKQSTAMTGMRRKENSIWLVYFKVWLSQDHSLRRWDVAAWILVYPLLNVFLIRSANTEYLFWVWHCFGHFWRSRQQTEATLSWNWCLKMGSNN